MEAKTMTPEGADFMRDILAGDEKDLANYIEKVGAEKACENIYKLAEYANDLTIQIEEHDDSALEEEARKAKDLVGMHDFYRDEYHRYESLAKKRAAAIKQLKDIIKAMSPIVTEQ